MKLKLSITAACLLVCMTAIVAGQTTERQPGRSFDAPQAAALAKLALDGLHRQYPNKPSNVMIGPESVQSPQEMHPAFYGCFDWHSSVHGHWLLVRLLRTHPQHALAKESRAALAKSLTRENIEKEAEYFTKKHNRSFERMYGWAWALRLAAELHEWDDPQGRAWAEAYRPLEQTIVARMKDYLPKLSFPIRTGVHPDTGFALAQGLDYARKVGDDELEELIVARARQYYAQDKAYPVAYEPSGEDFFSSGLNEADLMRRVLSEDDYQIWLSGFFPGLKQGKLGNLLRPAEVPDVTDGKLVHLAGLNFCRAWTLKGVAAHLPKDSAAAKLLQDSADAHTLAGMDYVFSGHYEGEHWLATFAVYVLTDVGVGD